MVHIDGSDNDRDAKILETVFMTRIKGNSRYTHSYSQCAWLELLSHWFLRLPSSTEHFWRSEVLEVSASSPGLDAERLKSTVTTCESEEEDSAEAIPSSYPLFS